MSKIEPRTLPGFMELLPKEQILFNKMKEKIRKSYEKFGFLPIDTPIIEMSDVLLAKAGGETEKQIYRFQKGDNDLALRFDLTVPLAKYVTEYYNDLSFPFRRYQIGKVYRGERPQKGRFREFYQCDIDIIGDGELSIINDAEMPAVIYSTIKDLGFEDFTICINNRKLLSGLFKELDLEEKSVDIMRIIDKIEKIGKENVIECLKDLELSENQINAIINFIEIDGTTEEKINSLEKLKLELYLNHEYDHKNCILEIHAGAGGTESCDWASMLYRMYLRYCEKKGYKVTVLDYQDGDEAGIKKCTLSIEGKDAYGYLKCEKGVHRLVRLSPFDANHKRHTSFASVDVTPEFDEKIDIVIKDEDLKIDVYHSSGAGGQSVNTTDSAVRITHLPTKIVVTCQNERSQLKNKEKALEILKNKLKMIEIERQEEKLNNLKQDNKNIEFGSQIRSYVMHPYSMVKDHRTSCETSNVSKVLDGDLDMFIEEYLRS